MGRQGPVFLHHAGRGGHAAVLELLNELLEGVKGLVVLRLELLAGDLLDGIGVVDQATSLNGDRVAVGLAVDADGVVGVFDPALVGQVDGVFLSQRVDILGVDHGDGVWILGGVLGGKMGGDGVVGVVDLDVHALLLGVLLGHLLHLAFDLDLGVEDGDLSAAGVRRSASTCAQHADGHQRSDDGGAGLLPRKKCSHCQSLSISTVHQATLPHEV